MDNVKDSKIQQDYAIETNILTPNRTKNRVNWTKLSLQYHEDLRNFEELEVQVNESTPILPKPAETPNKNDFDDYEPCEYHDLIEEESEIVIENEIIDVAANNSHTISKKEPLTMESLIQDSVSKF